MGNGGYLEGGMREDSRGRSGSIVVEKGLE